MPGLGIIIDRQRCEKSHSLNRVKSMTKSSWDSTESARLWVARDGRRVASRRRRKNEQKNSLNEEEKVMVYPDPLLQSTTLLYSEVNDGNVRPNWQRTKTEFMSSMREWETMHHA